MLYMVLIAMPQWLQNVIAVWKLKTSFFSMTKLCAMKLLYKIWNNKTNLLWTDSIIKELFKLPLIIVWFGAIFKKLYNIHTIGWGLIASTTSCNVNYQFSTGTALGLDNTAKARPKWLFGNYNSESEPKEATRSTESSYKPSILATKPTP